MDSFLIQQVTESFHIFLLAASSVLFVCLLIIRRKYNQYIEGKHEIKGTIKSVKAVVKGKFRLRVASGETEVGTDFTVMVPKWYKVGRSIKMVRANTEIKRGRLPIADPGEKYILLVPNKSLYLLQIVLISGVVFVYASYKLFA